MRLPTVLSSDELTIYLNDHLAGATFGLELARRVLASNRTNEFGSVLAELATEIEEDRHALERIFDRLTLPRDQAKMTAAWFAEKAGRVKLNGRVVGYSPLSRLLELEALSSGVHAKLNLWRALAVIAPSDSRLDEEELAGLAARAESQLEGLGRIQAWASEVALSP